MATAPSTTCTEYTSDENLSISISNFLPTTSLSPPTSHHHNNQSHYDKLFHTTDHKSTINYSAQLQPFTTSPPSQHVYRLSIRRRLRTPRHHGRVSSRLWPTKPLAMGGFGGMRPGMMGGMPGMGMGIPGMMGGLPGMGMGRGVPMGYAGGMPDIYGGLPGAFGANPMAGRYGAMPMGGAYDAMPMGGAYGGFPMAGGFSMPSTPGFGVARCPFPGIAGAGGAGFPGAGFAGAGFPGAGAGNAGRPWMNGAAPRYGAGEFVPGFVNPNSVHPSRAGSAAGGFI